jgi:phosphoribosylformylglycinamidine (FGAM) synthase PurS component
MDKQQVRAEAEEQMEALRNSLLINPLSHRARIRNFRDELQDLHAFHLSE